MSEPAIPTAVQIPEDGSARALERRRVGLWAVIALLMISAFLLVKIIFRLPDSSNTLYAYGVAVTGVAALQISVAFLRYRDPAFKGTRLSPNGAPLFVSALVAVHNEEEVVEICIRSMVQQTYPHMEIIVVDDASTDGTASVLAELAKTLPIRVVSLADNVGKKKALAAGMLVAKGDLFAFTDSDSTWARNAVARCVSIFEANPDVGAVSGHCRAMNADKNLLTRIQDTWYEGQFSVRKAFESHFGAVTCVSGPLAVFRRAAIYNYVPAWEKDRFLGQEFRFATDRMMTGFVLMDERHAKKVRKVAEGTAFAEPAFPHQKWRTIYCKSARSLTVVPDSMRSMIKQQVRWKKSFIRNLFFTGAFYWKRPFLTALVYYLHVLFVLAGPLIAFRHVIYMPLHGSYESMFLYLAGITLIGTVFGAAFRAEDPDGGYRWYYRPLMSLFSTLVLTWLIAYSVVTLRKMTWSRG